MGKFPYLKLSFIFYPLLSLFLLPIISCSTLDLSTIISDLKYNQTSSEIGEELGSIDEKQKKILRKKDKEIILLQERIYQLTKLKKTIEKTIDDKDMKLNQFRNLQNASINKLDFLSGKLAEKNKLISELIVKLSKLEKLKLIAKQNEKGGESSTSNNLKISEERENLLNRKESLDQREKELDSRERSLTFKEDTRNDNGITEETFNEETFKLGPRGNSWPEKREHSLW
jgi:chromosome segregation ATPase